MKTSLLVAACAFALNPVPEQPYLVLVPEGNFRGIDGRPFEKTATNGWTLTPARGQQMVTALNSQRVDMVIDYEHATLHAKERGGEAPAAGWCKTGKFSYIDGVGICSTDWCWNERAASQIANKEYRYLSPVFLYAANGEIYSLLHASLTNTPNLDTLPEALLAAAAQAYFPHTTESGMDELLEQLRWMLNLPLSATAEEIMAELQKLQNQIKEKLGVTLAANSKHLFDAVDAAALQLAANSQAVPDPAKFVPIAVVQGLQAKLAEVQTGHQANAVEELITAACDDGRLLGDEMVSWARDWGQRDLPALQQYLDKAPKIPALNGKQTAHLRVAANSQHASSTHASTPAPRPGADDYESQIAAQMGLH